MNTYFDNKVAQVLHMILVGLCKLTGRDNFFVAICTMLVADFLFIAAVMVQFQREPWLALPFGLMTVVYMWLSLMFIGIFQSMRERVEAGGETFLAVQQTGEELVPMFVKGIPACLVLVCVGVVINTSSIADWQFVGVPLGLSGIIFLLSGLIFSYDFQGRGKSVSRKVVDSLKERASKLSWGGLTPHPS